MSLVVYERKKIEIIPEQAILSKGCPCFEERKKPRFRVDTLLALLGDLNPNINEFPNTLEIPTNGQRFVFQQSSTQGSSLYYLMRVEVAESTQQPNPHTYQ
ncbi:hypothetical protein HYV88_06150 [Candidatus Woesearchaeota archaeon]|nr:hypothetical protein [Candidatus Woesearchaeota archaeon]